MDGYITIHNFPSLYDPIWMFSVLFDPSMVVSFEADLWTEYKKEDIIRYTLFDRILLHNFDLKQIFFAELTRQCPVRLRPRRHQNQTGRLATGQTCSIYHHIPQRRWAERILASRSPVGRTPIGLGWRSVVEQWLHRYQTGKLYSFRSTPDPAEAMWSKFPSKLGVWVCVVRTKAAFRLFLDNEPCCPIIFLSGKTHAGRLANFLLDQFEFHCCLPNWFLGSWMGNDVSCPLTQILHVNLPRKICPRARCSFDLWLWNQTNHGISLVFAASPNTKHCFRAQPEVYRNRPVESELGQSRLSTKAPWCSVQMIFYEWNQSILSQSNGSNRSAGFLRSVYGSPCFVQCLQVFKHWRKTDLLEEPWISSLEKRSRSKGAFDLEHVLNLNMNWLHYLLLTRIHVVVNNEEAAVHVTPQVTKRPMYQLKVVALALVPDGHFGLIASDEAAEIFTHCLQPEKRVCGYWVCMRLLAAALLRSLSFEDSFVGTVHILTLWLKKFFPNEWSSWTHERIVFCANRTMKMATVDKKVSVDLGREMREERLLDLGNKPRKMSKLGSTLNVTRRKTYLNQKQNVETISANFFPVTNPASGGPTFGPRKLIPKTTPPAHCEHLAANHTDMDLDSKAPSIILCRSQNVQPFLVCALVLQVDGGGAEVLAPGGDNVSESSGSEASTDGTDGSDSDLNISPKLHKHIPTNGYAHLSSGTSSLLSLDLCDFS